MLNASQIPHAANATNSSQRYHVYIGTYTNSSSHGIYRFELDVLPGNTSKADLAAGADNPSFLAVNTSSRRVFAVNEVESFGGNQSGSVSSFQIDDTSGALRLISQQPSGGTGPCHLKLSPDGKFLALANYGSGSVALVPVDAQGRLSPPVSTVQHCGSSVDPKRQKGPHAHSTSFDASGRWLLAADLGLDEVITYSVAPQGILTRIGEAPITPSSGPRSLAWHPNRTWAYVTSEMANTLTLLEFDTTTGKLTQKQTIGTLPQDWQGTSHGAEVGVHPNGRWVYVSNRGHDSIAIFSVDAASGELTPHGHIPTGGKFPRHFAIDPTGAWLLVANQNSDNITLFRINSQTGVLTQTSEVGGISQPVCLMFVPVYE